ncbi:TonB-dependent siderophore receptor [Methylosinus sp. H3A]|uniref:TonB-dependent siderophore receptor n=1 Tax=Methylosinus sp. H3A TaxID=2785786 RepID=UPI0018C30DE6|nr:TonB-dependent siderophore receptor [Methylosinus sp. H3A]MBG0812444.1 TonB-dependent siderophore receptor [Methylosinus sp. H3A]
MSYRQSLRGASAGALAAFLLAEAALAQEALPTIDIAAEAQGRAKTKERPGSSREGAGLGGRVTGYTVDFETPSLSGKSQVPLMQAPFAVQVVTHQTMDDRQAISLADAVSGNVSGVQAMEGGYDRFIIRGFEAGALTFRDNLQMSRYFARLQTANLQSVEILKGPASMLFGRFEPGGMVNIITKKPLDTPYYSVQEQFGSWGLTRTILDATGPLTPDKEWLYRIVASYNRSDSFRDYVWGQDVLLAPSLSWRPTENFRVNFQGEYQNSIFTYDSAPQLVAIGTRPASIPISRFLGDPAVTPYNPSREERFLIGLDWTYEIAPDWSLTNRFAFNTVNFKDRFVSISGLNESTGVATKAVFDGNLPNRRSLATNLDLTGKFVTGPFTHSILLGWDYYRYREEVSGYNNSNFGKINIYAPAYSPLGSYMKAITNYSYGGGDEWRGLYGQDKISIFDDRVHLLLGGRVDWADSSTTDTKSTLSEALATMRTATDNAASPRIGLLIQPWSWLSLYGNYSRSFGVTNALPPSGVAVFAPQSGRQFEGGIKAELLDRRLTATIAYYDIVKSNVVQSIPGTTFSEVIGQVESEGVELDVNGRLDENWSVIANYAYDHAWVSKDSSGPAAFGGREGRRLRDVPFHQGSVWVKYEAGGELTGLSLAAGVFAVGERQGDNNSSFQVPGYARVDTMIQYELPAFLVPWAKKATAQLNVRNLLDTTYYSTATSRTAIYPGAPRTFMGSLRLEF